VDIDNALNELRWNGWTTVTGKPIELTTALIINGYSRAATQRGATRQTLKPVSKSDAPRLTMSAQVGFGAQPLHTDGAHLREPPDVIALYSAEPNNTPTYVWSATTKNGTPWHPEFAQFGLFTVRNGRNSFLAAAAEGATVRFDPTCMSPADGYARQAAEHFSSLKPVAHHWDEADTILLIDNRHCLHARGEVSAGDAERVLERRTFQWSRP